MPLNFVSDSPTKCQVYRFISCVSSWSIPSFVSVRIFHTVIVTLFLALYTCLILDTSILMNISRHGHFYPGRQPIRYECWRGIHSFVLCSVRAHPSSGQPTADILAHGSLLCHGHMDIDSTG